jgi:WXG100 family type VII secretion target
MADTTVDFKVDLPALAEATGAVQREAGNIRQTSEKLLTVFNNVMLNWRGGSGNSFREEVPKFRKAEEQLVDLLDEAVKRMKIAHDNYVAAEEKNNATLKPIAGEGKTVLGSKGSKIPKQKVAEGNTPTKPTDTTTPLPRGVTQLVDANGNPIPTVPGTPRLESTVAKVGK